MLMEPSGVEERLRAALNGGHLGTQATERAERLLSRLTSPVRLAVLGPRGIGKSTLVNVLAGSDVIPVDVKLPTVQLTWAAEADTNCTYADGTKRSFVAPKARDLSRDNPIFIEMERPLPSLQKVALLEVVMSANINDQIKAVTWATERCDIALWCTQDFDEDEQALWARVPDSVRRHAFLVLTRADLPPMRQNIPGHMARLREVSKGGFKLVRPIASGLALEALAADDADALKRSGATALMEAVESEVESGQQTIRDAAEVLLTKASLENDPDRPTSKPTAAASDKLKAALADRSAATAARIAEAARAASSGAPKPKSSPARAKSKSFRPKSAAAKRPRSTPKPTSTPAPEPAAPVPETQVAAPTLSEAGQATAEGLAKKLAQFGATHLETLREHPEDGGETVMAGVVDEAMGLTDDLDALSEADAEIFEPVRTMIEDAADLVQLMQMEQSETATADAVCLLLQVKRKIDTLRAT